MLKSAIFLCSLLLLIGLIPITSPYLYPIKVQQIDGQIVDWHYIIVEDILDYPIWCANAGQKTVGCTNYTYRIMLIEDKFYQYEGIDTFTHEYIHARCDYNGGNWHIANNNAQYDTTIDYWNTCGR
jgi:hypothetical protein